MKPHIKAKITLYDTHKKVYTGYRPAHLIKSDYLTTGIQQYLGKDWLYPNESTEGYITFCSPEAYPHCLSVGQCMSMQEGAKVVGVVEVLEIYDKILEKE